VTTPTKGKIKKFGRLINFKKTSKAFFKIFEENMARWGGLSSPRGHVVSDLVGTTVLTLLDEN
jgi:hypothetical protein